jgi:hypothetical protein
MARGRSEYTRLPGRMVGLFRRHTLWLGADHLLRVRSTRFREDYRRYYLRDIQAICIQKRPPRSWLPYALTAGAGALFTIGLFRLAHPVWATLLAIAVIVYALAVWFRSDCEVWIQTALGMDQLPSLRRRGPAAKAIAIINARVSEAQNATTGAELAEVLASPPPLPSAMAAAPGTFPPRLPVTPARSPSGAYIFAFALLLSLGILKAADAFSPGWLPTLALPIGYVGFMIAILVPLIWRGISRLSRMRAAAVLTSLGVTGATGGVAVRWSVARSTVTMRDANVERLYESMAANTVFNAIIATILILLALWGLFAFLGEWQASGRGGDGPVTLFGTERP